MAGTIAAIVVVYVHWLFQFL